MCKCSWGANTSSRAAAVVDFPAPVVVADQAGAEQQAKAHPSQGFHHGWQPQIRKARNAHEDNAPRQGLVAS